MIRVLDEARSVDFYRRALGLEVIDRLAFDGFTLLYLRAPEGPFELELTVNHDRTAPYALGEAMRFRHHPDHVAALARAAGFTEAARREVVLRTEKGAPVAGVLFALTRP
jgi:catechol 2,3-dioxygenase-like lactoylglutathione lyase family enzyme